MSTRGLFLLTALAACSSKPAPVGPACTLDSDCRVGELCIDDGCTPGCRSGRDCPADKPQCDPAAGAHGQCVVCLSMNDCPEGMDCVMGACKDVCSGNNDCPSGQICIEQTCLPGCTGDRDCAAPTGRCDPALGERGTCVECLGAEDCGGGACGADGTCHTNKLDILFVIDNSGSMGAKQQYLAAASHAFFDALAGGGELPDLHVGVVSSNVGIGGFTSPGCDGVGDAGGLQNVARLPDCTPPSGAFISDEIKADGSRDANYTGTIGETFNCIAELGTRGCGLEQHLESMKLALDGSNPANAGFLRPEAYLAVVIFADEDDCSASDMEIFDTAPYLDTLDSTLGPFGSFRCTEFGVKCDGMNISRSAADYTSCEPRGDSYLWGAEHYAGFLQSLKADGARRIIAGVIAGDPSPFGVMVAPNTGSPELKPSCMNDDPNGNGTGYPAVRMGAFSMALSGSFDTICTTNYTGALNGIAGRIREAMQ